MSRLVPVPARWRFVAKIIAAVALVIVADQFFWRQDPGSVVGAFALAWAFATAALHKAVRRDRSALIALGIAIFMGGVLAYQPSILGWMLFWTALTMAALLPRTAVFGDAWQWARRLLFQGVVGVFGPLMDWFRIQKVQKRTGRFRLMQHLPSLVLPIIGGGIFLILFSAANPLINDALASIEFSGFDIESIFRLIFAGIVLVTLWGSFRPRRLRININPLADGTAREFAGISIVSVTVSLLLFNAMFALQNALDIVYLWSDAPLPDGMTLAQYAHRGAYPLIATALLAGLFVLVTTRPGSPMARNKPIRILVIAWVAQNIFLVASSMLRTADYIAFYDLTVMRIAALLWMGLVALGLLLICLRLMFSKSSAWLVNANAGAGLLFLAGCSAVDLGGVAARWNVTHQHDHAEVDLCYLNSLNGAALLPLIDLEARTKDWEYREQIGHVRMDVQTRIIAQQADWHSWTWRDADRLAQLPKGLPLLPKAKVSFGVSCDGLLYDAAAVQEAGASAEEVGAYATARDQAPLTPEAKR
jgi:Domain of unknown function (DUF4173)